MTTPTVKKTLSLGETSFGSVSLLRVPGSTEKGTEDCYQLVARGVTTYVGESGNEVLVPVIVVEDLPLPLKNEWAKQLVEYATQQLASSTVSTV